MLDLFLNRRAIAFLNWVWNKEACSLDSVKSTGIICFIFDFSRGLRDSISWGRIVSKDDVDVDPNVACQAKACVVHPWCCTAEGVC